MQFYEIIILVLTGLACGTVSAMGLGGGTLLIPVLTIFLGFNQKFAQFINLAVFVPTAIIAIIFHIKNKLIDFKTFFVVVGFGVGVSLLASFLIKGIDSSVLKIIFAIFILCVAVVQIVVLIKNIIKNKKDNKFCQNTKKRIKKD